MVLCEIVGIHNGHEAAYKAKVDQYHIKREGVFSYGRNKNEHIGNW